MRHAVALVLAACTSGGSQVEAIHALTGAPVHGAHAASIDLVAVTDDGAAVVSQDAVGGTRLWPTLDGAREPIVVHAPMARELGVISDTDSGFAIAALDAVGGVDLIRIAATGEQRSRVQIGSDPAIVHVVMTHGRVLALRADQSLVAYDLGGAEVARLVPTAGDRIETVLARHGHVLALIRGEELRGRWIDGDMKWGASTPALSVSDPKRAVLSPDGTKLAVARLHDVAFVELAIGYERKPFVCPAVMTKDPAMFEPPLPIGFTSDSRLTCFDGTAASWWDDDGTTGAIPDARVPEAIAVGDGIIVTALRGQLELHTAQATRYLGYDVTTISQLRVAPVGIVIGKGDQQPLLLDDALRERRRFVLGGDPRDLTDVVALDDRYVLVSHSETTGDVPVHKIAIVDTLLHAVRQELPYAVIASDLRYEPATRLLVVTDAGGPKVVRFDPSTMRFGDAIRLDDGVRHDSDVHLVDPALAGGVAAIVIHTYSGRLEIREFVAADLQVGAPVAMHRSYELFGPLVAIDRAARVYVAVDDGIAGYTYQSESKAHTSLAHFIVNKDAIVRPSPDATAIAVLADQVVRVYDASGALRWQHVAALATDTGWANGEVFVRWAGALATLDPATGRSTTRTCGWSFGVATTPRDDVAIAETDSVCDAE